MKKTTADEVRKSKNRNASRKSYYRMKNNEAKYKKHIIRSRKNQQTSREAKEEGVSVKEYISNIKNDEKVVAETLLSLGKEG